MQPRRGFRRLHRIKPTRQKPGDKPRQYIARPGSGQPRGSTLILCRVDRTAPIRMCNYRVRALEQHNTARPFRRRARGIHFGIGRAFGRHRIQLFSDIREQPRKLSAMGRQHAPLVQHLKQCLRVILIGRQRIRIQHRRVGFNPTLPQRHRHQLPRPFQPQPRPQTQRIDPLVLQHFGQPISPLNPFQHQGCDLPGHLHLRRRRHTNRHHPCPNPQRAPCRQPRRPGFARATGKDQGVAVGVFVIILAFAKSYGHSGAFGKRVWFSKHSCLLRGYFWQDGDQSPIPLITKLPHLESPSRMTCPRFAR